MKNREIMISALKQNATGMRCTDKAAITLTNITTGHPRGTGSEKALQHRRLRKPSISNLRNRANSTRSHTDFVSRLRPLGFAAAAL